MVLEETSRSGGIDAREMVRRDVDSWFPFFNVLLALYFGLYRLQHCGNNHSYSLLTQKLPVWNTQSIILYTLWLWLLLVLAC